MERTPTPDSERTAAGTPKEAPKDADLSKDAQPKDVEKQPVAQPPEVMAEVKTIQKSKRRWLLLSIFCLSIFLDVSVRSGLFVFVDTIAGDLGIPYQTSTWVLNSYTITFGAILPLWGRLSDLFSAKPVFILGFAGFGVCQIIISVLPERYSYFVFRGLSGIFAAATIPSAFRLIASVFAPAEIPLAMTLFSVSGGVANSFGLIFGGVVGLIPTTGQMTAWRWFFRIVGIVVLPFCFLTYRLCPKTYGSRAKDSSKWRQIDIPGVMLIFTPNALLVLGLTFGASYGWRTASFLVPFLLAWPLYIAFFLWEAHLPTRDALVPPSFWKLPNVAVILFAAMEILSFWTVIQIPLVERFERVYGESNIISAVRLLPIGVAALFVALFTPKILPKFNIRTTMTMSLLISAFMFILLIYSHGEVTENAAYWKYIFPALIVGSGGVGVAFTASNITIIKSVPPEMSGVAGALLQVAYQTGSALGLGIQSGLLSVNPGDIANFSNVQISWWFQFGWQMVCTILVAVFLRDPLRAKPKQGPPPGKEEPAGEPKPSE